jgi:hypothetical protein
VSAFRNLSIKLTVQIRGQPYQLTVTPDYFKLIPKGKRQGIELPWSALVSEDAAMLSGLHATIKRAAGQRRRH